MATSAAAVRPPVLRSRPLGALLAAEVLSTTGSQMTWLALPWFVLVTTGSAKQMTLVIAAEAGGFALVGIPSGSVLERLGAQRTMRLCDAVRAPLMLLVPVLHSTGHLSLPSLAAIAFVLGAASTPYMAAQRAVVAETLDEGRDLGRARQRTAPGSDADHDALAPHAAAAGQLAAMSYAAFVTIRHLAREPEPA